MELNVERQSGWPCHQYLVTKTARGVIGDVAEVIAEDGLIVEWAVVYCPAKVSVLSRDAAVLDYLLDLMQHTWGRRNTEATIAMASRHSIITMNIPKLVEETEEEEVIYNHPYFLIWK